MNKTMNFLEKFKVMDDDRLRFSEACDRAVNRFNGEKTNEIGTLSEKTVHAALKNYFGNEEYQEIKVGSFYADVKVPEGIFEIQTRQFYTQKRKLEAFLPENRVCMVYPVKYGSVLHWIDPETGEISKGRKSPKTNMGYGIFHELYGIREYVGHENLSFCLLYYESDEYKYLNGYGRDRKIRAHRADGIPNRLVAEVNLCSPEDYLIFIPPELFEKEFGSAEFAGLSGTDKGTARMTLLMLRELGLVKIVGRSREGNIHVVCPTIFS